MLRSYFSVSRLGSREDVRSDNQRSYPPPHWVRPLFAVGFEARGRQARYDEGLEKGV